MYLQYIIYITLAYSVTLILASLTVYVWQRRTSAQAAATFAWTLALTALWALMDGIWIAVPSPAIALFCYKLAYLGVALIPVTWLIFALQYTERLERLNLLYVAILVAIPLITQVLLWSNERHNLFLANLAFTMSGPFRIIDTQQAAYGPWFWVHAIYGYLLTLLGILLIVWKAIRSFRLYRGQALVLLFSVFLVLTVNVIHTFDLIPGIKVDISSLGFALGSLVMAWGFLGYQLFDVVPVARKIIIEGMGDGMLVLDTRDRVVDFNPAAQRIAGISPDHIGEALPNALRAKLIGIDGRREIQVQERWYDTRVMALNDRQSRPAGQLVVLHDVTERKRAEDEMRWAKETAEEANRLKSALVSMVSHDLRTPLNAILGYTEMLQEFVYGPLSDRQQTSVDRIGANAQRLLSLVNDLLDQAQIEAGKLTLETISFEPAELVNDVVNVMGVLAQTKGLELTTHVDDDVPGSLQGDPHRLQQVLINLLSNALKFTETGSVHIRIFQPDETHWALAVSDTGTGISPDKLTHVFERFYQVESDVTTRKHPGIGLGLAIVKQLVELMGGEVSVESELGKGSTFSVTLPLIPPGNKEPAQAT
ncbi:MAG: PAS domain-containing protein [Thermoflexales bacterium]|nr:PAS domain-containing protein [Thermoflexales bacterium]